MKPEEILNLFDSCWFGPKDPNLFYSSRFGSSVRELLDSCLSFGSTLLELCHSFVSEPCGSPTAMLMAYKMNESNISGARNLRFLSLSDRCLGVNMSEEEALSKASAIIKPKLQKILSGKQVVEFSRELENASQKPRIGRRRRRGRKGSMDLGFVFNEEDKNPGLISVVLGLHDEEEVIGEKGESSCRACLSEEWIGNSNFVKIPSLENEIRMKDHLRVWARTVASNVR